MSAIVGYRDKILQAAPIRNIAPAADAFLLLTADTPVFHVTLDGAGNPISGSPANINLTAALFNLPGPVTWAVVSGTAVLTGTGNTRQLTYSTMSTDTATVRASTTYSGVTFQMELIISKVRDGAAGVPGTPGTIGKSARIAFTLVNGFSLNYSPLTVTVSGDTKPVTGTWGETAVWKDAIDSAPAAGQAWFQSNGTYDATAGVNSTVWRTPYMSNLKVGSLEALAVKTGSLDVDGALTVGAGGRISSGQTAFNVGTGFWLGTDAGVPKFSVGTGGGVGMRWDGSNLYIVNPVIQSFNLTIVANAGDYFTLPKNIVDGYAGSYTATPTGGSGNYRYLWRAEKGANVTFIVATSYISATIVPEVSGGGYVGEADFQLICTVTDTDTGQSKTEVFVFVVNFT